MNYENTIIEKLFILLCLIIVICGIILGNKTPQYEYWVSVFEQNVWIKSWQETISWTKVSNTKSWSTVNKQTIRDIKLNNSSEVQSIQLMSGKIIHKWFASWDIRQQYVQYAYDIWWWNLVLLNECENAQWTLNRKGDSWLAIGMCQIQLYRYDDIDQERYKTDYKYQLDTCWKKRSEGTLFYWPTRKINWQYCYNYVKDRFIIN